jgi:hypothetical protein
MPIGKYRFLLCIWAAERRGRVTATDSDIIERPDNHNIPNAPREGLAQDAAEH